MQRVAPWGTIDSELSLVRHFGEHFRKTVVVSSVLVSDAVRDMDQGLYLPYMLWSLP
jgi:hypothetical protein